MSTTVAYTQGGSRISTHDDPANAEYHSAFSHGSDPADTASPKLKRRWSERQEEQRKHKEKDDEQKEKDDEQKEKDDKEFAPRKALKKKKKRLSQKKAKEGKKKKEAKMKQATADSKAQSVLT